MYDQPLTAGCRSSVPKNGANHPSHDAAPPAVPTNRGKLSAMSTGSFFSADLATKPRTQAVRTAIF